MAFKDSKILKSSLFSVLRLASMPLLKPCKKVFKIKFSQASWTFFKASANLSLSKPFFSTKFSALWMFSGLNLFSTFTLVFAAFRAMA